MKSILLLNQICKGPFSLHTGNILSLHNSIIPHETANIYKLKYPLFLWKSEQNSVDIKYNHKQCLQPRITNIKLWRHKAICTHR